MLKVKRTGSTVTILVDTGLSEFPFSFNAGAEWAAMLLEEKLIATFDRRIRAVREEEYLAGLKDARKPKIKRRYFYSPWLDLGRKK